MKASSQTLVADVAMSLKGHRDDDCGGWWSGWKRHHWPANVLRRGFRFYAYDKETHTLFAIVEITKGGAFTYTTLAEFERKVKQIAGFSPGRDDPHWKRLPRPASGKFCTGYAFQWKRVRSVSIPWSRRFPQLGWATVTANNGHRAETDTDEQFIEDRKYRKHLAIERDAKLRARAKDYWRDRLGQIRCLACGFSFERRYGVWGADFIEMHHLEPLAALRGPRKSHPRKLVPLCSNCHRMVHRRAREPLSMPTLRRCLRLTAASRPTRARAARAADAGRYAA